MISYIQLCAKNDTNGNPRRIFVVFDGIEMIATVDEGYNGNAQVKKKWPDARFMGDFETTPREYRRLCKFVNHVSS